MTNPLWVVFWYVVAMLLGELIDAARDRWWKEP